MGWTTEVTEAHPEKCIICLAPHTSNWDFLIGQLYNGAHGLKSNFLMKKEWFFWPLGPMFRRMGGIPVYRQKHTSMTDSMAETAAGTQPLPPVHHTRGHPHGYEVEEGLLLHCPKGRAAHPALWRGL